MVNLVGTAGFEPATPCTPSKCASRAALRSEDCLNIFLLILSTPPVISNIFHVVLPHFELKILLDTPAPTVYHLLSTEIHHYYALSVYSQRFLAELR